MGETVKVSLNLHLKRKSNNSLEIRSGPAQKKSKTVSQKSLRKPRGSVPRVVRLLALAHHFQGLLDQGMVSDYADIARLANVTRARVTQIMDLLLLAPEIQEKLLLDYKALGVVLTKSERRLRKIGRNIHWKDQISLCDDLTCCIR